MAPTRAVLSTIAVLALGAGAAVCAVVLTGNEDDRSAIAALGLVIGWSFVVSGLVAWSRRPANRTGLLMIVVGFTWFLAELQYGDDPGVVTAGVLLENVPLILLAYLLLAFPTGRLESWLHRAVIVIGVLDVTVGQLAWMLFTDLERAENLLQVAENDGLALAILDTQRVVGVILSAITIAILARRWHTASAPLRRAVAPVLSAGTAAFALLLVSILNDTIEQPLGDIEWLSLAVLATIPFAFLAGLLRTRLARSAVADLVVELGAAAPPGGLREALARALGDPSLTIAYWLREQARYVDADGRPVELLTEGSRRAATVVEREGHPVAALVHDPALRDDPTLVDAVCAAAGLALENARLHADLRARLEELGASRARIVEAAQAERRRIERNLHDGTQQRLVAVAMTLGLAESKLADSEAARTILGEARQALGAALAELRELSQGIHPGILTERGLTPALEELAYRAGVPVEVVVSLDERLPAPVEAAAYYVASESLANVAKHARATAASVRVGRQNGRVVIEVADDGVGDADGARGSGLRGLADRVDALGGRLALVSPAGRGTIVRAEIPCG